MSRVIRVTLFKIASKENQAKHFELYRTLSNTATKDGKPYILSLHVGIAQEDARAQGYTVVAKSEFKDMDDLNYYDTECEAHKVLKEGVKALDVQGVMTVFYTPEVIVGKGM